MRIGSRGIHVVSTTHPAKDDPTAKPNYEFAKRQRDLAKKEKKEAKKLKKAAAAAESENRGMDAEVQGENVVPAGTGSAAADDKPAP